MIGAYVGGGGGWRGHMLGGGYVGSSLHRGHSYQSPIDV